MYLANVLAWSADTALMVATSPRIIHRSRSSTIAVLISAGFLCGLSIQACGQIAGDGTGRISSSSAFFTIGGENTQLPGYADNALGFDMGVTMQPRPLLGLEFRAGAYPFSATYVQIPFTAGYSIAANSFFGFPYRPFAYFGGGVSRSQDRGLGIATYPPNWQRCLQADIGFDRTYGSFSWRVAQASYRKTDTSIHSYRSLGLSTGFVYYFRRRLPSR